MASDETTTRALRIYLAGPDVFRPDAVAHGERLKALCAVHGCEGLYPLDQAVPAGIAEPAAQAAWIYRANLGLLESADAVLANLNFFRGAEPDSGTCFEVGYAVARGKPVYGHVEAPGSLAMRIRQRHPEWCGTVPGTDRHGWMLEEFGLPLNLMLAVPGIIVCGSVEQALARMAADLCGRAGR